MNPPLLSVRGLAKTFRSDSGTVYALRDLSFDVYAGECLAVVGESGSGKSTAANLILGVYPPSAGELLWRGEPLPIRRQLRHRRAIQLVQQNPLSSLNPKRRVGASIGLALQVHGFAAGNLSAQIAELLNEVGLPAEYAARLPGQLSGGERQRVAIARALACRSELVVLDEPTSALDVLVQARVLRLLSELRAKRNLSYIFISHDLSVVRNSADRVAVIDGGRLVELNRTETIFSRPSHAYTRRLISAVPVISDDELALRDSLAQPVNQPENH